MGAADQHEINQPLGAILSNADAADLLLASGADRRDELRAILADIRPDNLRASEVVRRLRALFAKQPVDWHPFDLNDAVRELEPCPSPVPSSKPTAAASEPNPVPARARCSVFSPARPTWLPACRR